MLEELRALEGKALTELESLSTTEGLEKWRVAFLGRKGALTEILRSIGQLPPEQRPTLGQEANRLKLALEGAYEQKAEVLKRTEVQRQLAQEGVDVTLPGRPVAPGFLHLSTQTLREIYAIFGAMGFQVFEAPDVETDINNFQLLNIPPYHPARDKWSTFHTTREGVLLRTHTSPGQIRAMRQYCPEPIRVILPGKCYRYEQVTARHESMFYQVEGLAIGRNVAMGDLKGVLTHFARQMFGPERKVRFRADYFPFTEPSAEMDIECVLCDGKGCRVCKNSGWVEILGSGMVHPQVLRNGGYDPAAHTGFAFGMGLERIAMLKYAVDDIRYFYTNDLRFLQQFA
jgi:phenylalanyl-tRNA synthetase alpha chain